MRYIEWRLICMGLLVCVSAPVLAQPAPSLATQSAQEAYAMGQELGGPFKALDADIDVEALLLGIRDGLENKPSRLSRQDLAAASGRGRSSMARQREEKLKGLRERHAREGKGFRDENQKKPGVITTQSGLQYTISVPGNGAQPTPGSRVRLRYKGVLVDGKTEVESSASPTVVTVGQGFPGWNEALQLMRAGGTYRFVIPPELGYGEQGFPGKAPPGATLIYVITLEEIVK